MRRIITLVAMLLMYLLSALSIPAYAESHVKADSTTTGADSKQKVEEEEPECD